MSEIKLSDEDIKRIAGEVVKLLAPPAPMPPLQKRGFNIPAWQWEPTPTPGLPYGWQAPYSSFV